MVGETRPTHEIANNAITVLRNITILRQRYRSLPRAHCRWRSLRKVAIGFDKSVAQVFASDSKLNLKLENESSAQEEGMPPVRRTISLKWHCVSDERDDSGMRLLAPEMPVILQPFRASKRSSKCRLSSP
jgi:hypothetical protein